jgi:ABC-type sugar transport system substrate-binding protein
VRDGYIEGTIVQQPYEFGYQSVKLMAALARGDESKLPKDKVIHVPHFAITKSGNALETLELKDGDKTYPGKKTEGKEVEAFRKKLHEMLGKK